MNCFCQCSYICEFNIEAGLDSCSEEDTHAIHEEWIWIDTEIMYLQPMSFQHVPFPAAMNCMMITRVAGAMKERKSDTNMRWNQY
jgi:hypothetical protein